MTRAVLPPPSIPRRVNAPGDLQRRLPARQGLRSAARRTFALGLGLGPLAALLPGCAQPPDAGDGPGLAGHSRPGSRELAVDASASGWASASAPLRLLRTGDVGGLPTVLLTTQGRSGRWLLDTGATMHVVSPTLAAALGLVATGRSEVATLGGTTTLRRVRLPPLSIGERFWQASDALMAPLDEYFAPTGESLDGILGLPALAERACRIDIAGGTFTTGASALRPDGAGHTLSVPLETERGLPVLSLGLGDREPERFLLDTGLPGALVIYARRVRSLVPSASALPQLTVRELTGDVTAGFASMAGVRLGDRVWRDVPTALASSSVERRGGSFDKLSGAVGTALFEGASLHLDLPGRRLQAHWPGGVAELPGGWGFGLRATPGGVVIGAVFADGPAGRAGVRSGAPVVAVDGQPTRGETPSDIWARVRERSALVLDVGEASERRSVRLARERFFPPIA